MANELQFFGLIAQAGLTVTARVYDSTGTQSGSGISCPEVGSTAVYVGDMPSVSSGQYVVRFLASGEVIGAGTIVWDGTQELQPAATLDPTAAKLDELHRMRGLDSANPVTVTPTAEVAGDISLTISGDGVTTSTLTRP